MLLRLISISIRPAQVLPRPARLSSEFANARAGEVGLVRGRWYIPAMSRGDWRFFASMAMIVVFATTACSGDSGDSGQGPAGPPSGSESWGRVGSGNGRGVGYGIAQSSAGDVAITGAFDQTADLGAGVLTSKGSNDVYVARYDVAGKPLWSKSFGDGEAQLGIAVDIDAAGNTILGGNNAGTIDVGGGPLSAPGGEQDVFVAQLGPAGAHVWSREFGDKSFQSIADLVVDSSGNVLATGTNAGTIDFGNGPITAGGTHDGWIAKLDGAGKVAWSLGLGLAGAGAAQGTGIAVDPTSNVYVVGSFQGTLDLGGGPLTAEADEDILVAKLDAAGHHVWSKRFGGPGAQNVTSVAVDRQGNVYLIGALAGATDFGGGAIGGAASLFLVRLDTNGNHVWSKTFDGGRDARFARSRRMPTGTFV